MDQWLPLRLGNGYGMNLLSFRVMHTSGLYNIIISVTAADDDPLPLSFTNQSIFKDHEKNWAEL